MDFESIVNEFLRITAPANQRACCNRHGVRVHTEIECDCEDWDFERLWCRNCGRTLAEIMEGK